MTAAVVPAKKKRLAEGSKYSRSDVMKLKEMFDMHDLDNDGCVTVSELLGALRTSPLREQALSAFRVVDLNKNCVLTFDEYLRRMYPYANDKEYKVMLSWVQPAPAEAQREAIFKPSAQQLKEIATMFDRFDSNRNGVIEIHELLAAADEFGYDEHEVTELFKNTDKNMNGAISFQEFVGLMEMSYI